MNSQYKVGRELTFSRADCILGVCPTIYEAIQKADVQKDCLLGGCPDIIDRPNGYIIIGTRLTDEQIKEMGLESKIASNEGAVFVPKEIIDKLNR